MSRRLLALGVVAMLLVAAQATARADSAKAAVAEGAAAFAAQEYAQSIAAYERAVDAGLRHPSLYYNLGNAYFRAGRLGQAILWYERALRADPSLEDARYNLEVAREVVAARMGKDEVKGAGKDPFWISAVHWLPLPALLLLVLLLDLTLFGLLIALRFTPTGFVRTGLAVGSVFAFVAGAAAALLLFGRLYFLDHVRMSVVVADEVVMRETPDPSSREMPKLHAGHRVVAVREQVGADGRPYWRVRLANQVEGWVPRDAVEPIAIDARW